MIGRWIASWHVWRATRLYGRKDLEGARNAVSRAIEIDPDLPLSAQYLGIIALKQGRIKEAEEHLMRAVGQGGDPFVVHQGLGALEIVRKRYAEAESRFKEALSAFPVAYEVGYHIGLARFLSGDEAGAFSEFLQVLSREDDPLFKRIGRLEKLK
ncbi:MAG: tetratricopeptide repeat protein [Planctomycetota bacterium]|jgi:tetratricopeptide (TPR) repeat protein